MAKLREKRGLVQLNPKINLGMKHERRLQCSIDFEELLRKMSGRKGLVRHQGAFGNHVLPLRMHSTRRQNA